MPPILTIEATFSDEEVLVESNATRILDSALFWGLCGLLLFGPLAFGAVEPWSMAILQSCSVVLFLGWCARQYFARSIFIDSSPLFAPIAAFAAVVTSQWIFKTTSYSNATTLEASNYFAFAILVFLTTQIVRSERQLKAVAVVLATFGFLLALFAILQSLTSNGMLYWVRQPRYSSSIYGPYVNRNHYAGLMEMLAPLALALCFSHFFSPAKRILFGFAAVVMGASIFLSASRAGASAFVAEMVFFAVISSNLKRGRRFHWGIAIFFLLLIGFLFWIDIASAFDRWSSVQDELKGGRLAMARDCLTMFMRRPVFGWGLGSFPFVYPQFRSFYTDYFINQAHNDYLQVLVETGVVGALAMMWFIVNLYRSSLGRIRDSRSRISNTVRLAALTGCTGLLVHSAADFNLHVPGNAAIFFVFCVVASGQHLCDTSAQKNR